MVQEIAKKIDPYGEEGRSQDLSLHSQGEYQALARVEMRGVCAILSLWGGDGYYQPVLNLNTWRKRQLKQRSKITLLEDGRVVSIHIECGGWSAMKAIRLLAMRNANYGLAWSHRVAEEWLVVASLSLVSCWFPGPPCMLGARALWEISKSRRSCRDHREYASAPATTRSAWPWHRSNSSVATTGSSHYWGDPG